MLKLYCILIISGCQTSMDFVIRRKILEYTFILQSLMLLNPILTLLSTKPRGNIYKLI